MENYRGISMLPRISIILERILFNHIYERVRPFLSSKQFGFRSGRGTTIQLDQLYKGFDATDDMHAIYFDVQKAFDTVCQKTLLSKLQRIGFDDNFLAIISSYLDCRTEQVKINRSLSVSALIISGVLQGSVLGPLLFLIYINDLPNCIAHSSCFLFADDCKLLCKYADLLQFDVNNICNWMNNNYLHLHPSKTKHFSIFENNVILYLDVLLIDKVSTIKDLGVYFSKNLSWSNHINNKLANCNRSLFFVKHNVPFSAPVETKFNIYVACVKSILLYNSSIWYPAISDLHKMEALQKEIFNGCLVTGIIAIVLLAWVPYLFATSLFYLILFYLANCSRGFMNLIFPIMLRWLVRVRVCAQLVEWFFNYIRLKNFTLALLIFIEL